MFARFRSTRRNNILILGALSLLLFTLAACAPETTEVEVTRVVEVEVETEVTRVIEVETEAEVTRIIETEVETEVEVTRVVEIPVTGPQHGGTMVVAITDDPGHFNPGITTGFNVHAVTGSIFNGLVELDDNANPSPDLAESWEVSEDSQTYTFTLREGVTWHDGAPFTSADVKFTFEEILFNFHSRTRSGLSGIVESIETPDDTTVVFNFSSPYAPLLQRLNSTEAAILPKHIYENVADAQTAPENLTPIGTGPYRLIEYNIDDTIVLERNENYFKEGLPYLDSVIFRVIPDRNTQLLALEQGEVDFIWRVPGGEISRLATDLSINLYRLNSGPGGGFCVPTLTFNSEREIFSDLRVRQAIAHAIDRQQLVDQVLFGQGKAATGPINSQMTFAYTDDKPTYELDTEKANALLDEAGLAPDANGERFTINVLLFSSFIKYGEVIRDNLSEVGINVEVTPLDRSAFIPRVFGERDFDTNVISYCNNTDPSIGVSRMYISTNIGDIPFSNGAAYVNPTIDDLFAQGAQANDIGQRGEIYAEIQNILLEELPYWWLTEVNFVAGAGANVRGIQPWSGHVVEAAWLDND